MVFHCVKIIILISGNSLDPVSKIPSNNINLREHKTHYKILINSNGSEQFLVKLKTIFVNYMENDSDVPEHINKTLGFGIRANFFAGGIANLFQAWFRNEIDISLNELSLELNRSISSDSGLFFQ